MDTFDTVYVINMDEAKDRLAIAKKQLEEVGLGFVRVPGVQGGRKEVVDARIRQGDVHPTSAVLCSKGVIGCALSHLDVWRACALGGHGGLVLEDDVLLLPGFVEKARAALHNVPPDFDILLLGYNLAEDTPTGSLVATYPRAINSHIIKPSLFYGTYCYVVSPRGAKKLARMWQVIVQVDIQLGMDRRVVVYAAATPIAKQNGMDSYVTPLPFPKIINAGLLRAEVPGLNFYGRSVMHPMVWVVLAWVAGWYAIYPPAIGAVFVVEAVTGVSTWWAVTLGVWITGLLMRRRWRMPGR